MPLTEKVTEKVNELKGDLRETVEDLKEDVSELKNKLMNLVPGRRESSGPVAVRREPRDVLTEWRRETDRMFDEMWRGFGFPGQRWPDRPFGTGLMDAGMDWPRIDVEDRKDEIRVSAEIPGIDEKDLDVQLSENHLTIRGEKGAEHEDKREGSYYRSERFYGSFERTIPLPTEVDFEKIDAKFRKGVLTVRLPKTAAARERARRITVRSS